MSLDSHLLSAMVLGRPSRRSLLLVLHTCPAPAPAPWRLSSLKSALRTSRISLPI